MGKTVLFLCLCFISSGVLAVESGNTDAKKDSLIAKLKSITSPDTGSSASEKIEIQSSKKDSLIEKLKSMSTSDSSTYEPKKKEWYDTKGSAFGENSENTTLQDGGTYLEGNEAGARAGKGNEMLIGAAVGALSPVLLTLGIPFAGYYIGVAAAYAYPLAIVSGNPSAQITEGIKNKGEDYKKGFLKGYKRKKKMNALVGTTCGCAGTLAVAVGAAFLLIASW